MDEHLSQAPSDSRRTRTWSLTISGLLLLAQAVFLAVLVPALIGRELARQSQGLWDPWTGPLRLSLVRGPALSLQVFYGTASARVDTALLAAAAYLPLVPAGLVIGSTLLAMRRYSWLFAMLLQALILALSLFFYLTLRPPYVYMVMLSGVVLVGYLNTEDVRLVFAEEEAEAAILTAEEGANGA